MSSDQTSPNGEQGRSRCESFLARLKLPKMTTKVKQRYNMTKVSKTDESSDNQRLECGRVLDYFKKAFVYSSSWCVGTPTLKQCSWSQISIMQTSSSDGAGDECCSSSTASISDSGLSSGDDVSAESSPKLQSACKHLYETPEDPPVKPPRLLKKRKQTLCANLSIGVLSPSTTIPVVPRDPNDVLSITPPVIIQPPSSNENHPIHSRSPIVSHTMTLLSHGPRGLGLEVSGGIDSKTPVVIERVDDESPFKGKVFKGDYLWIINGEHVQGLKNAQIIQLLAGNSRHGTPKEEEISVSVLPDCSRPLEASIAELEAAVQSRSLAALYNSVPRYDPRQTHLASKAPANHEKNRYSDIVAYDSTRVLLTPNEFNGESDYINANHVNMTLTGSNTVYRYIATQGPKSSTVSDFWQMVLEQGSRLVVMLTTLHEGSMAKCFKYWPDEGTKTKDILGAWTIRQLAAAGEGAWIQRRFELKNENTGEERHVTHLQYVKWPDHGVPQHSQDFVDFVHLVREFRAEAPLAPVIVHCSAGVGRTGVFIMMETAMGLIEEGQAVRPQQLLQFMREQRPSLVQTESQFSFVVKAILRVFVEGTVKPCS